MSTQTRSDLERARQRLARRRIWIATAAYLGIIYVSQWALWFLKGAHPALLAAVGLTPMIGIALMLRAIVLAHRESDELQRRIDGEAAVIAACVVGLCSFAYGLALAAMGARTQPSIAAMFIGPALIGVWGLAKSVLTRRYG
jgi:NADH:ubiquinone oxidoreductase subunit K